MAFGKVITGGEIVSTTTNGAGADVNVVDTGGGHLQWECTGCLQQGVVGGYPYQIHAYAQEHADSCRFKSVE